MSGDQRVVFLRGIMGRSGTNFLRDLLLLHPDCVRSRPPVWEDFFLDEADRLRGYADAVGRRWPRKWEVPQPETHRELMAAVGRGLCDFLAAGTTGKVVLAKTPSVAGIEHYFDLFGESPLIILIRDGRAVVDSAVRSFGWTFERAVREWARGGQFVRAFDEHFRKTHGDRYRIVRYEDLTADVVGGAEELCRFIGLDPSALDPGEAKTLPVRGSSALVADGGAADASPHWRPVPKEELRRPEAGARWTTSQRRRFAWLAGETMVALGYPYEPDDFGVRPAPQLLADTRWALGAMVKRTGSRIRRR